jgi:photosystem II stability/assembly factor-like uncharacterized protein
MRAIGLSSLRAAVLFLAAGATVSASDWRRAGLEGEIVTAVAVDPASSSTVWAGAQFSGIWKSLDGGATWTRSSAGYTGDITAFLIVDPVRPGTLYAASNVGVFKSANSGASWSPVNSGLPGLAVSALAMDPVNTSTLYVAVDDHSSGGGIYRTVNGASTWQHFPLPVPSAPARALATRGSDVYAGWGNVLFRSSDAGATWTMPYPDVLLGGIQAISAPAGRTEVLVGLNQLGIYRGVSTPVPAWEAASSGLTTLRISVLVSSPANPDVVFTAGNGGGVFRSADGGRNWTALDAGLANTDVAALAADSTGRRLYAATGDGVFAIDLDAPPPPPCGSATALCLTQGRFRVEVAWRVPAQGTSGVGTAIPITDDTGTFWFFTPSNLELMIKVLDARVINARFWVFYGALSDVAYTVTVTDTATGAVKRYENPSGHLASVADTDAFSD